jgi:hypothetical protein
MSMLHADLNVGMQQTSDLPFDADVETSLLTESNT